MRDKLLRFNKTKVTLFLIILLAFFLRFVNIENNPKGIYGDELTAVYDAYSILKTGHDQQGNFLPIVFNLGGSRPPLYVYVTVPFTALFGPGALAARSVSILSGVGLVLVLFFLGKYFIDEKMGLIVAFLTAISPWSLSISRGGFESNFALFLATLGVYAFFKGLKNNSWFFWSALFFALSMQTYPTYRVIVPLLAVFLFLSERKNLISSFKKPQVLLGLLIFISSFVLSLVVTLGRAKDDRFASINIFADPDIKTRIETKVTADRELDQLPPSLSSLTHNKLFEYSGLLASNFLKNLSPDFLFISGDRQPRHNPAEMGQLYWTDIILITIGAAFLLRKKDKILITLLGWVLIAPTATALVGEPHALRSSFLLPPLLLLSSFGFYQLCLIKNLKGLVLALIFLYGLQFILLSDRIYFVSANKFYNFWSYPAKEATVIALKNQSRFDRVFISNNIPDMEFAYPVYAKLDPKLVIDTNLHKTYIGQFNFLKYGNVYIGSLPYGYLKEFLNSFPGSLLYIGSAEKEASYLQNYQLITEPDNWNSLVIVSKGNITY